MEYDSWRLEIPWLPPSLNVWMRLHFMERDRLLQDAGLILKPYLSVVLKDLGIQDSLPFKAEMTFQVYAKKKRDDDNCVVARKVILDCMKKLSFLKDDDPEHIRSIDLPCEVDRKRPRTVIVIKRADGAKL